MGFWFNLICGKPAEVPLVKPDSSENLEPVNNQWSHPYPRMPLDEAVIPPKKKRTKIKVVPPNYKHLEDGGEFLPDAVVLAAFKKGGAAWAKLIKMSPRYIAASKALRKAIKNPKKPELPRDHAFWKMLYLNGPWSLEGYFKKVDSGKIKPCRPKHVNLGGISEKDLKSNYTNPRESQTTDDYYPATEEWKSRGVRINLRPSKNPRQKTKKHK